MKRHTKWIARLADDQLNATRLRSGRYVVRPIGALGTIGWHPIPWDAIYVTARSPSAAIQAARRA